MQRVVAEVVPEQSRSDNVCSCRVSFRFGTAMFSIVVRNVICCLAGMPSTTGIVVAAQQLCAWLVRLLSLIWPRLFQRMQV